MPGDIYFLIFSLTVLEYTFPERIKLVFHGDGDNQLLNRRDEADEPKESLTLQKCEMVAGCLIFFIFLRRDLNILYGRFEHFVMKF